MRGFIAFTKKEFTENVRNYRVLVMLVIFSIFGIMSPLAAKFMPELIAAISPELSQVFGIPTALDSWVQFYKNISQMGLILTIILFSGCLSGEYIKGTLTIMLTKGLSRWVVILSKFSIAALIFTASYWLAFGITYGYTAYFWAESSLSNIFFAAFALWLAGLLYLCILMLGCVLFRQSFASIIFLLAVITVGGFLGQFELTAAYSPSFLISKNLNLISGLVPMSEFIKPMIITVIMSATLLVLSVVGFNKKQV